MAAPVLKAVAKPRTMMGLTLYLWGLVLACVVTAYFVSGERAIVAFIAAAPAYLIAHRILQQEPHFDTIVIGGGSMGHFMVGHAMMLRRGTFWRVDGQMYEG